MSLVAQVPVTLSQLSALLGPDDELSSATINPVLESLAGRDSQLAEAFNALLAQFKQTGYVVPVVLPAISLGPLETARIGNFRIPKGWSLAVLNAAVATTPNAGQAQLNVVYNPLTFGSDGSTSSASVLISTLGETISATAKVQVGELVFVVANQSSVRISVTASLLLSLFN
jgi:hypothetical protein